MYHDPVELVREGVWLYDKQGSRYLDCYNNVASVSHCHPRSVTAQAEQAAVLNTHTRYLNEPIVNYAEHQAGALPEGLDVCLFCCTGTEANEPAIARLNRTKSGAAPFICDAIFDTQGTLNAPEKYFKLLYKTVRAAGGLCIADEVQAGFGRMGNYMRGGLNTTALCRILSPWASPWEMAPGGSGGHTPGHCG